MVHITEHASKVSTRSVYTLTPVGVCGKCYSKTDRHTDELSKTTFLAVLGVVHPKSGLISKSIFCTMPILPLTWKENHLSAIEALDCTVRPVALYRDSILIPILCHSVQYLPVQN